MQLVPWPAVVAGLVLLTGGGVLGERGDDQRFQVEMHDTIQRTLRLPAGAVQRFELSNLSGSLAVTGTSGGVIELSGEREVRGASRADVDEARRASDPIVSETATGAAVYGAGSLRGSCDASRGRQHDAQRRRSQVRTQYEVRVPAGLELRLCTVNGTIRVRAVTGPLIINSVNGRISVEDVSGPVTLTTVNGGVTADVNTPPREAMRVRTVNGGVQLFLAGTVSADLWMKTVNGGVFSNFDTAPLAGPPPRFERRNGMRVYRRDRRVGVRVGSGGPRIEIETVNGDIRIERRTTAGQ